MAMTIVEAARTITGGIDTHGEVHVAAALDDVGGLLGVTSRGVVSLPDGATSTLRSSCHQSVALATSNDGIGLSRAIEPSAM